MYGKERLKYNDILFKSTSDCLNSIKAVKFYNVENYFKNSFTKSQKNFLDLTAKNIIISKISFQKKLNLIQIKHF